MIFLLILALGLFSGGAVAMPVLTSPTSTRPTDLHSSSDSNGAMLRLAWFNALDRSFSVDIEESEPVRVSLHAPDGAFLALIHDGTLSPRGILHAPTDIPPGVYLLRVRQSDHQVLERVTLF